MAVVHPEAGQVRHYNPARLRGRPGVRIPYLSPRTAAIGVIIVGGVLQHILVTAPLEPLPATLPQFTLQQTAVLHLAAAVDTKRTAALVSVPLRAPVKKAQIVLGMSMPSHLRGDRPGRDAGPVTRPTPRGPIVRLPGQPAPHRAILPVPRSPLLPPIGAAGDALRTALALNPNGEIMHLPSISVAAVRAALQGAGSPALGASYADGKDAAEYIWDAGRVMGIDPAVLMAIFHHESVYGTQGIARQTQSVGNIRPIGNQPSLNGYRLYASWQQGIDACYRLLRQYAQHGAATVLQAIPVWAPTADDNNVNAYVASVLATMTALSQASTPS